MWPTDIEAEVLVDAVDEPEVVELGDELLGARATTVFRGLVARVNFLAQDRGDLQCASKECSRKMSAPRLEGYQENRSIPFWLPSHCHEILLAGRTQPLHDVHRQ